MKKLLLSLLVVVIASLSAVEMKASDIKMPVESLTEVNVIADNPFEEMSSTALLPAEMEKADQNAIATDVIVVIIDDGETIIVIVIIIE
jgi:Na+-transporting methylmalonyl-CoA/oxaloacetate decarboxylase gamma subunit